MYYLKSRCSALGQVSTAVLKSHELNRTCECRQKTHTAQRDVCSACCFEDSGVAEFPAAFPGPRGRSALRLDVVMLACTCGCVQGAAMTESQRGLECAVTTTRPLTVRSHACQCVLPQTKGCRGRGHRPGSTWCSSHPPPPERTQRPAEGRQNGSDMTG